MKLILFTLISVAILFLCLSFITTQHPPSPGITTPTPIKAQLGVQTKTIDCHSNGALPDSSCTPGAIDVTLTKEMLCSSSFSTKSIRNVPEAEKKQVYSSYGITAHKPGQYEVDHLISLEIGGSNDTANLWPEPADPRPGFHEKDIVENYLHKQVCRGMLTLQEAQQQIATDWVAIYQSIHQ